MNFNIIFFIFINICSTFTCFASNPSSDEITQGLSDAEIAIIGLSPPNERTQRTQTQEENVSPVLNPQESLTSSFITYDDNEEEQTNPSDKPFTITFPISRSTRNKQSVQSIVIPLPSELSDKTGIIVIEDHDDGGNLDRRTLRAQFFSPTRIRPYRPQPLREEIREEKNRNETESSLNRIIVSNKRLQTNSNRTPRKPTTETKAEPSTTSSVVFDDDDVITITSTFSPESVFRPKAALLTNQKKQNSTSNPKPIHPIIDTMTISVKARQRVSKKSKSLPKSIPKTTPKSTTTTTTTTTTTEVPTTTEFESEEEFENTENTESTTFTTPETTTRNNILKQLASLNDRPNVRRKWNAIPITTQRPTTTLRPTTTERSTTLRTTTQRTTESITTQRPIQRTVPQRRRKSGRRQTTTTTTARPTTVTTRRWETTTSVPIDTTEVDYELISLDNSTKSNVEINSLKLTKPKNRTISANNESNETVLKPRPPSAPKIPGNFGGGFLPSGKAFNYPHNVPGSAGIDYPTYDRIPVTPFDCREQTYPGFYADLETGCQVYHSCNGNQRGSRHTFLCPNGTIFSQEYLICDWWYNVNCNDSPIYYTLNKEAFSAPNKQIKTNSTKIKNNLKKTKPKTTTTEFVIRTITTTDLP